MFGHDLDAEGAATPHCGDVSCQVLAVLDVCGHRPARRFRSGLRRHTVIYVGNLAVQRFSRQLVHAFAFVWAIAEPVADAIMRLPQIATVVDANRRQRDQRQPTRLWMLQMHARSKSASRCVPTLEFGREKKSEKKEVEEKKVT